MRSQNVTPIDHLSDAHQKLNEARLSSVEVDDDEVGELMEEIEEMIEQLAQP